MDLAEVIENLRIRPIAYYDERARPFFLTAGIFLPLMIAAGIYREEWPSSLLGALIFWLFLKGWLDGEQLLIRYPSVTSVSTIRETQQSLWLPMDLLVSLPVVLEFDGQTKLTELVVALNDHGVIKRVSLPVPRGKVKQGAFLFISPEGSSRKRLHFAGLEMRALYAGGIRAEVRLRMPRNGVLDMSPTQESG